MIKKIGILLLISSSVIAQDKGKFESYSNNFYGKIVEESKEYDKGEKEEYKSFKNISGYMDISEFIQSVKRPRNIFLMIKAGAAIDEVIEQLLPFLSENDIVIDGHKASCNKHSKSQTFECWCKTSKQSSWTLT